MAQVVKHEVCLADSLPRLSHGATFIDDTTRASLHLGTKRQGHLYGMGMVKVNAAD
jgi:hypothetical protein